ncbi:hypothetical protein HKB47_11565 [Mesorhizobium japonicum]|uniref:Uncharacterized protein n=4 Tax=Mesorhizobium TaxID=68287 RepID=A0A1A5I4Z0_RHILI|nr:MULTISPECIES: hypothetical protein [Mesorhizobium]MBE1706260.1 hypothetical protein [Mesorhizobium japonicum]MBE1715229.1 hypothetical protein [Mesorhizobium japonicum]MUT21815.1 hypothetical protein [Mesorhizobium japonicum]MUT27666.1 hypothetical protein [Mesorhizobium japonicum]OBP74279.1 hypothetical protein BAE39_18160 [Mesorhizobium loti]
MRVLRDANVMLTLAAVTVLIFMIGIVSAMILEEYAKVRGAYAVYQARSEQDRHDAQKAIAQSCFGMDRPTFVQCVSDKIEVYDRSQDNNQDLQAQKDMAFWAFCTFLTSCGSLAITGVGIYYVRNTLLSSIEATNRELRAYLSVSPDGINPLQIRPMVIGHVSVKNVGQAIAKDVHLMVRMTISQNRDLSGFEVSKAESKPTGSIAPTASIWKGSVQTLSFAEIIPEAGKQNYLYVWGAVYYDDGFRQRRRTAFCHRYDTDSRVTEKDKAGQITNIHISADKARYTETGNDAD